MDVGAAMRGLLSAAPSPSAIRLILGTHLLLVVQAGVILWSAQGLAPALRVLVGLVLGLAIGGLAGALHGLADEDPTPRWRRRHAR